MSERRHYLDLTPSERQEVLRRLKRAPAMAKEELGEYACKVRLAVLAKREKKEQKEKKEQNRR